MNKYSSTRIWDKTVRKMRLISALTGESHVELLDRIVREEAIENRVAIELIQRIDNGTEEAINNIT